MRKNISDCHPSFSLENVQGSSNSKEIKSGRSLDLAYQLGAMTRRDCHVASLLAMTIKGLTPPAPSYIRGGEKGELSYIRGGVMGIIAMTIIGLFSFNAYAECMPTPDCADMGYTETSCDGSFVRCPFDTSKLFCAPCDSSFRYDCSGDNIVGGTGSTCGGKYVSCTCTSGFSFENGECKCPASITTTSCSVGAIYYPDGKCSNDYAACLNPVGVVVKDNALVMSWRTGSIQWGGYGTDISDLPNYSNSTNAKTDYDGVGNTTKIVAHFGEDVDVTKHAGVFCYNYAPVGMESTKGQWYLPAAGELYDYVYGNYNTLLNIYKTHLGYSSFSYSFWSSSERSDNYAWGVYSYHDEVGGYNKSSNLSVSCFIEI